MFILDFVVHQINYINMGNYSLLLEPPPSMGLNTMLVSNLAVRFNLRIELEPAWYMTVWKWFRFFMVLVQFYSSYDYVFYDFDFNQVQNLKAIQFWFEKKNVKE